MDFKTISYEEWIARLQKELKSEDLSKFHVRIDKGLTTDPFFQRNTSGQSGSRVEKIWKAKHVFQGKSVDNHQLLQCLEGGINSIEIYEANEIEDLQTLFKNVFLDYIDLHLHLTNESQIDLDNFVSFFNSLDNSEKFNIYYYPTTSNNYNSKSDNEIVNELSEIFNDIIQEIDQSDNIQSKAREFRITRYLSKDIIKEIAIRRAISLLWNNTLAGFDLEKIELKVHATCIAEENKELESKYIAISSKGLTAVMAGYESVYIAPASEEKRVFHQRISRNIHHLLSMESFIQKSNEAFKGSYQIERIAKEIAEKCWKNIGRH